MKKLHLNYNGIQFNIICEDANYKKINEIFLKMFPTNNEKKILDYTFNIYYIEDYTLWNKLELFRQKSNIELLKPNIEKCTYNGYKMFYSRKFYCIANNDIDFYVCTLDNKYAPYYVILELVQRTFEKHNHFIYHGNGISIDGINMSIIGNSGSGKTALMSKLLQCNLPEKHFLSNDRIIIGNEYTSAFPIEIHLKSDIVEHDYYLKHSKLIKNNYIKPSSFVSLYPDVKYSFLQNNHTIIIPKIDTFNKNNIELINKNHLLKKALDDNCFTLLDKETLRDYWLTTPRYNKKELIKQINNLNNYLIDNYNTFELKYGCNVQGEEIYEKIRSKI